MNIIYLRVDVTGHHDRDKFVCFFHNWDGARLSELVFKSLVKNNLLPVSLISRDSKHSEIRLPSKRTVKVLNEDVV